MAAVAALSVSLFGSVTGLAALSFGLQTRQTPVLKYDRQLKQALLHDRLPIAKIVSTRVLTLDEAPKGYAEIDKGIAANFVLDPDGVIAKPR